MQSLVTSLSQECQAYDYSTRHKPQTQFPLSQRRVRKGRRSTAVFRLPEELSTDFRTPQGTMEHHARESAPRSGNARDHQCSLGDEIDSVASLDEEAGSGDEAERLEFAKKEDCAVWYLRILCFLSFGVFAIAMIFLVFVKLSKREQQDFDHGFDVSAAKLISTIDRVAKARFGQITHFANDITSHAEFTKKKSNITWPMVTLPNFEFRARETARLSDVISIYMFTRVSGEQKDDFLAYTQEEKGWIDQSIAYNTGVEIEDLNFTFPLGEDLITRIGAGQYAPFDFENASAPGYFGWQSYPMRKGATLLRNIPEGAGEGTAVAHVIATHQPAFNKSFHFMDLSPNTTNRRREAFQEYLQLYEGLEYEEDPALNAYYPVYDKILGDNREVVAVLLVGIYWRSYFVNIFAPGNPAIQIVLENSHNQSYTYVVEGSSASFVGVGDLHDETFSNKKMSYDITSLPENAVGSDSAPFCTYTIHVYPTKQVEQFYKTRAPLTFALSMASVFFLTSIFFLLYDLCVGLRQAKVLKRAQQAGSLVQNLFPTDVRKRLYQEQEVKEQQHEEEQQKPMWALKKRKNSGVDKVADADSSTAIAKGYPECTVLFADLKGFTNWSASRTP